MLTAKDVLIRECTRLLDALQVGLSMVRKAYPVEYQALKNKYEQLWKE